MKICKAHPHSSEETARECYHKHIQRKLDKRLGRFEQLQMMTKYRQIKCNPPQIIKLGNIEVIYFYKGIPK